MSTHIQLIQLGGLEGLLYVFDKRGEGLMAHTHKEDTAHDVLVINGAVKIYGNVPEQVLMMGEHCEFDWTAVHEIVALTDGASIFNRFLYGIPEPYRNLPPELKIGKAEDTLHSPISYNSILSR
jgi:hypothetical protein